MQTLVIGAGVVLAIVWAVWFVAQKVKAMPAKAETADALATFNELVGALKSSGKLDSAVQASIVAIREAVAEIAMPLDTDREDA